MNADKAKKEAQENYKLVTEIYEEVLTSAAEISRQTSVPARTVSRYIELWKKRIPVEEIKTKGRPLKITPANRSFICSEIARTSFLSANDLRQRLLVKKGIEVINVINIRYRIKLCEITSELPATPTPHQEQFLSSRLHKKQIASNGA